MTGAYAEIARLLRAARRRQTGIVLLARAGTGLAATLLCLLAGAIALRSGARLPLRFAALAGAALALLWGAAQVARDLLRGLWSDEAAARTLAAGEPALRSALESSVELTRDRARIAEAGQLSVGLLDAHVAQTAARVKGLDLSRALPSRAARPAAWLLAAAVLACVVSLAAGRGALARSFLRVLRGDPAGSPSQVDPITGDIELTYQYPAYMHREPRTLSGTGGEIRAPKGTEVTVRTRADRVVAAAELVIDAEAAQPPAPAALQGTGAGPGTADAAAPVSSVPASPAASAASVAPSAPAAPASRRTALRVEGGRELSGSFLVMGAGSYRFRFLDAKGRLLVEGPPIPIVVEPDAFPTVRITAPDKEVEVDPGAVVEIGWQAEDDVAVGEVTLVVKPEGPEAEEQRIPLRSGDPVRRDEGSHSLALAPLHAAEGERFTYHLEAQDTDDVSGPKVSSSDAQVIRIYSEAEHRRQVLERARQAYEELVAVLGDRLDLGAQGPLSTEERLPQAQALDGRTRLLTEHLREAARAVRRDPAGPRPVAQALDNVAQEVRFAVEGAIASRSRLSLALRLQRESPDELRRQRARDEGRVALQMVHHDDSSVEGVMEKGVLYLEQLLDKQRAEDLVRLAKDLSKKRRDLADLMERYRKAPSEGAKQELLAEVRRMREQVRDLLGRMAELSKGFNDEHMNEEALAELAKSQDLMGGLDEVEKKLAQGDVEGAMKALDQMASAMDRMTAGLDRTAGLPDEKSRALLQEMLAFKEQLGKIEREQKEAAAETDKIRAEYRRKVAERLKQAEELLQHLHELAVAARKDVESARPGITFRAEPDYETTGEALAELERALAMRELDGAADASRRTQPPLERLSGYLEEDASSLGGPLGGKGRAEVDDAQRKVADAVPKVREIKDQLSRLFPDPRSVLSKEDQKKLGELAKRQGELEKEAGELQEALALLSKKAPVFPPSAQGELGESRGHMGEAAEELGGRNPQRGHGQQQLALDALARFRKGLEDAAKSMQQGGGGQGEGFPFPFAEGGQEDGQGRGEDGFDPSREKVKIPGAEAHKVPEAFRKDLLEAMKQGTPERYRADVQRYYEELVK
jgi:hypothetical protein